MTRIQNSSRGDIFAEGTSTFIIDRLMKSRYTIQYKREAFIRGRVQARTRNKCGGCQLGLLNKKQNKEVIYLCRARANLLVLWCPVAGAEERGWGATRYSGARARGNEGNTFKARCAKNKERAVKRGHYIPNHASANKTKGGVAQLARGDANYF